MHLINKELCLINILDMPSYLTSVVLSEAGPNKNEEYYKVQVILSRTYALNTLINIKKKFLIYAIEYIVKHSKSLLITNILRF